MRQMHTRNFIVATAGHVDHGKSALVKALTGTDPDRLPEEKARGITIDLGFAHLGLSALIDGHVSTISVGLVDVPGHEDFVKNMVAGVGSIDLALLVVAADDGWMPQTEEHLQILTYLGVSRAIIALTKIDLVPSAEAQTIGRIREKLKGTPFVDAPIVCTSVVTSQGIEHTRQTLATVLASTPPPCDFGKPRLPIDRVFVLRGIGTVVTGTLSGGILQRGQTVMLQPSGKTTRIRSLHSHNREIEAVGPGTRAALNLPDVGSNAEGADGVTSASRGEVVTIAELGSGTDAIDVLLEKSERLLNAQSAAGRPLKDGALVRVHHGSGNAAARVLLLEVPALAPGERALAQLRFSKRIFACAGDRFIIRDWSEQNTLAGGVVLEADGSRARLRKAEYLHCLTQRAQAPDDAGVFARSQLVRDRAIREALLLVKTRFSAAEIKRVIADLVERAEAVRLNEWLIEMAWWGTIRQRASELIHAEHHLHPERAGLNLNDLRVAIEGELPAQELWEALRADLCRRDFVQNGTDIRAASHCPALPPQLQAAGNKVRALLNTKLLEPPSKKELCPDAASQQALRFLIQTGDAIELNEETVLGTEHFTRAKESIQQFLQQKGSGTASELRQLLGTNRRIIIPLLERLDRDGVTLRQGDQRRLRAKSKS
jgi:selenocysteine-specific elongation factor